MVDGKNKTSYGPFINDRLSTEEANTEIVVGKDEKLYVKTTKRISVNNEFLMSYGGPYWLGPLNWALLPREVQLSVLNYYKCQPPPKPTTSECICSASAMSLDTEQTTDSVSDKLTSNSSTPTQPPNIARRHDRDTVEHHPNHSISDSGRPFHRVTVTRYQATRPPIEPQAILPGSSGHLYRCFGTSRNACTRISFPYLDDTLSALIQLLTNIQLIQRIEAPAMLRATLGTTETLPLVYWKN